MSENLDRIWRMNIGGLPGGGKSAWLPRLLERARAEGFEPVPERTNQDDVQHDNANR
jgi:predicted ATPase